MKRAACHYWVHSKANKQGQFIEAFQVTLKGGDD